MTDTISRSRKTGVYAYALDWQKLGLYVLAGAAAAKYLDPALIAVLAPAAVKQVFTNLTQGAYAVGVASYQLAQREEQLAQLEKLANEGQEKSDE